VPNVSPSAESAFTESFPIGVDEFFKQEVADYEKSRESIDSPSDESSLTPKESSPQMSIFVETSNQIEIRTTEAKDTAFSSADSVWDDVDARPMEVEEQMMNSGQGAERTTPAKKRGRQYTESTKKMVGQVGDVAPNTKLSDAMVAVDARPSFPGLLLRDQRKRVTEARIAKERGRSTASEASPCAGRTKQNPRPSGNVQIVSDICHEASIQ
jgi:hypothetical protein